MARKRSMRKRHGLSKAFIVFIILYALVGCIAYFAARQSVDYRSRAGTQEIFSVMMKPGVRTDIANQDGSNFEANRTAASWIGTGSQSNSSFLGMRFVGLRIPTDAVILSAGVNFVSSVEQGGPISVVVGAEDAASPLTFSKKNSPSLRLLTGKKQVSIADEFWYKDSISTLDVTGTIQALYSSKTPNGAIALVFSGTGSQLTRKFFYNAVSTSRSPTLTIQYILPPPPTPTPTQEPSPTPTAPLSDSGPEVSTTPIGPSEAVTVKPTDTPRPTKSPTPTPTPFICTDC